MIPSPTDLYQRDRALSDAPLTDAALSDAAPGPSTSPANASPVPMTSRILLPTLVALAALALWAVLSASGLLPPYSFPSPLEVAQGFGLESAQGRLLDNIIASLFRVTVGFTLGAALGVPCGLWLGNSSRARAALLPHINFYRCLSPIAWIGFAITWFDIGDKSAIFLIFMATFFPIALATIAAVSSIPAVYFRVARDYGFRGRELLMQVTLPAILPQLITALRVTAGLAWVVIVAAEMAGAQEGLGFAIMDARNGQSPDLLVVNMIVIGLVGVTIDQLVVRLTLLPGVRWGYER